MQIISYNDRLDVPTVMTTGNFDGVHTGHIAVLSHLSRIGEEKKLTTALVTFRNHPRTFFHPDELHQSLTTFDEKAALLEDHVDYLIACDFDISFSRQSTKQFLHLLAARFSMKHYLTGHDHRIGHNREGGYSMLESIAASEGFEISKIEPLQNGGTTVSSTAIKTEIEQGCVERAGILLGYPYVLSGTIIHGRQLGRKMGFPTANIVPPEGKVFPSRGVYATVCTVRGRSYFSMTNIGYNPTIADQNPLTIETNILDFDEDIYDETASVYFVARIRDEISFTSVDALKSQLRSDIGSTLTALHGKDLWLSSFFTIQNIGLR